MAPEAAAVMLNLLLAKPIQENPGHHSLSSRAILWGRTMPRPQSKQAFYGLSHARGSAPTSRISG